MGWLKEVGRSVELTPANTKQELRLSEKGVNLYSEIKGDDVADEGREEEGEREVDEALDEKESVSESSSYSPDLSEDEVEKEEEEEEQEQLHIPLASSHYSLRSGENEIV